MEWLPAYLALGATVGLLAGMFGIGGGTILVPALLYLFEAQHLPAAHLMHLALGTAMANIIFTALASLRKHHQHDAVNWRIVLAITPGILIGTALGALSISHATMQFLGIFFALFVYFAAAQILFDVRPAASHPLPGKAGISAFGIFAGWLSSMVSIGGGTVVVPFLVWCKLPLKHAIGTAAAIGLPIALGGSLGYVFSGLTATGLPDHTLGFIHLPALFWIALSGMVTAPLGAKAAHRMNLNLLRKLFALLLIAVASQLLFKMI
ncbi:MAG: sulfite exporter TauE/SafE family protein [Pseudomonadota bacterium]